MKAFLDTTEAIPWAAGILEGEGCFALYHRKGSSGNMLQQFAIHCEMTDEDVIDALHEVFKLGTICHRTNNNRKDNCVRKPSWIWSVQRQKDVLEVLKIVRPYLFSRRLAKTEEMIELLEIKCQGK